MHYSVYPACILPNSRQIGVIPEEIISSLPMISLRAGGHSHAPNCQSEQSSSATTGSLSANIFFHFTARRKLRKAPSLRSIAQHHTHLLLKGRTLTATFTEAIVSQGGAHRANETTRECEETVTGHTVSCNLRDTRAKGTHAFDTTRTHACSVHDDATASRVPVEDATGVLVDSRVSL